MELNQQEYSELMELLEDKGRIKLLLQKINDTLEGGIRSTNLKEYRNTYIVNAQDSLDANYPLYVHFSIIPEMTKIVSIQLSFWLLNFRAYATAASSGGGSTSGSGGGQTSSSVTTPSGGGATSGATGSASGGGSTTPSGGGSTSGSGGSCTVYDLVNTDTAIQGSTVTAHEGGYFFATIPPAVDFSKANHRHSIPDHTHTTPNHTHSTPDHTHPNHTHSTPDHTHPVHSHTVSDHSHSTPNHTHSLNFGIFEDSTSPTVMFYISKDNGLTYSLPAGSYTKDQMNLDITRFIDTAGQKLIKFTSNARTRLSVQITIKLDIKAR